MAISFVGSLAPVGANNGGNVTLNFSNLQDSSGASATLQQNDLVIAAYASSITSDQAMATSSSGWTNEAEDYSNGTSFDTNLAVFRKVMGSTPDTSIVFTGPGGAANATIGVALALRGVDTTTPLDVSAVIAKGAGSGRPNPGSITPLANGAWIVIVGAASATTGAAFTNPGDLSSTTNHFRSANHAESNDAAIGIGLKTNWTSGAFDGAQWTGGTANAGDSWVAIALVIRPLSTTTHQGSFAASGAGGFTAVGGKLFTGSLDATGSGSFAASGFKALLASMVSLGSGAATLIGRLTAMGTATQGGTGSFAASGQIQGNPQLTRKGPMSLSLTRKSIGL